MALLSLINETRDYFREIADGVRSLIRGMRVTGRYFISSKEIVTQKYTENRAQLKNAQVDVARYKGLYDEDSIAKQTLDTAEAQVPQFQGLVKTNQAHVNDARLNLVLERR